MFLIKGQYSTNISMHRFDPFFFCLENEPIEDVPQTIDLSSDII